MTQIKEHLRASTTTYCTRYVEISGCKYNPFIYDNFLNEAKRVIITKWRLSNHRLKIETDRYITPKIPHEERKCSVCPVVEDEHHVLLNCSLYTTFREKFRKLLVRNNSSINSLLNPISISEAEELGAFLIDIEKIRQKSDLNNLLSN